MAVSDLLRHSLLYHFLSYTPPYVPSQHYPFPDPLNPVPRMLLAVLPTSPLPSPLKVPRLSGPLRHSILCHFPSYYKLSITCPHLGRLGS
ncbi:unnamed protein product [Meloidogyne enterolobii]|uniref:Uncharacterized protein n=1 Tax=Meloidogyne enterolobii TaxID=390850 RepID=A0ACB0YEK1_MELEN